MPRFFFNGVLSDLHSAVTLPINTIRHLHALRMRNGDTLELFNGNGYAYLAKLINLDKKSAIAEVFSRKDSKISNKIQIKLAMCMIANDKMDLVIQKAIELGVQEIIPVISERTQRVSNDKIDKKILHWQNIVISSCEQCGNNILPDIAPVHKFDDLVTKYSATSSIKKIIMSPQLYDLGNNISDADLNEVLLVVGPEGGFTDDEVSLAIIKGFSLMNLGNLIMRAETAAIAGIVVIHTKFKNWLVNG
ncbi:MAG: 16S rRNA (uracil(1498)-N(3))-methyltransferase [Proteobacteria bacterium]|jgi:16S rRNA (uracil1498-N3)-methyltransferase|nr:16S rRNA (uracil(1498)-N(3))-methyltransferase [Pseudomonadota bacterium]